MFVIILLTTVSPLGTVDRPSILKMNDEKFYSSVGESERNSVEWSGELDWNRRCVGLLND